MDVDKNDNSSDSTTTDSSNSDSEIDELDEASHGNAKREKRGFTENCCCFSPPAEQRNNVRVSWPPQPSSSASYQTWRHLRPVRMGNPLFGARMQLWCRTGIHLAIFPNGRVKGVKSEDNIYTLLHLISALYPGHVRIKGIVSNLYVAMDKRGRLYGEIMHFDPSIHGNPLTGNRMQLYSQNNYNLTVREDGQIAGTEDDEDPDTHLEISNAGAIAHVRIRNIYNGLYICFNPDGNLYGEGDPDNPGTVFKENIDGHYSVYRSLAFPKWYIGITKQGLSKYGPKTFGGQRAVKFLPRRSRFE